MAERSVLVRLRADISQFNRQMAAAGATTNAFIKDLDSADSRMSNLVQTALALAPALVPIGGAGVTALVGLTNQLGFAAAGAGVTALAFNGVGDALKALNDYQLEPTEAHFVKLQQAMEKLGPAAGEFVLFLDKVEPKLKSLQLAASEGLLPGAQEGMKELLKLTPQLRRVISEVADTTGDLLAEAGDNLNDPRWRTFFRFLETEARPTLTELGKTTGNLVEAFANMWMAFQPLSDQFSKGFLEMSRDFAEWSSTLDENQSFQSFLGYLERTGPKAVATLGALVHMLASFVQAAAPVGEATLPIITAVAEVLSAIAESPAGPVLIGAAAGISAVSRAVALFNVANGSAVANLLGFGGKPGSGIGQIGQRIAMFKAAAAGMGLLAVSLTDLDDKIGLSNTATLALIGSFAGPYGAAIGGAIGLTKDFAAANRDVDDALRVAGQAVQGTAADIEAALEGLKTQAADLAITGGLLDFKDNLQTVAAFITGKNHEIDRSAADLANAMNEGSGATGDFADVLLGSLKPSLGLTEREFDIASLSADGFRQSLLAINETLSRRADFRSYQAALDEFTAALKENGRTLDLDTEKGRVNEAALDAIAGTALKVAENLKGTNRVRFLKQAREDFLDAADKLNIGDAAARKLADSLGLVAKQHPKPKVELEGTEKAQSETSKTQKKLDALTKGYTAKVQVTNWQALAGISAVQTALNALHDKNITLTVVRKGQGYAPNAIADGGYIGDHITGPVRGPGGPRDDMVPARLSHGEYVVKAAAVEKYGIATFDRLNAMAYADGGSYPRSLRGGNMSARYGVMPDLGELTAAARAGAKSLADHGREVDRDREGLREHVKATKEAIASFKSTVAGTFQHDIFGNGLAGAMTQLQADRNDAMSMEAALRKARKLGLSGAAFQALAGSGDLLTAQDLDTRKEVRRFETAYGGRAQATRSLAGFAGEAAFGKAMHAHAKAIDRQDRTLDRLDRRMAGLEEAVKRGARDGTRAGMDANNRTGYGLRGN